MEYNPGRKNSNANEASYVRGNRVGVLYNLDHVVHEFGYMIGCSDKYYYNEEHQGVPMPGKEDDIMSGSGKPSSQTIAPVLDNILNDHNSSIWNRIKDFLGISTIYNVNSDDYSEPNTDTNKENKPK